MYENVKFWFVELSWKLCTFWPNQQKVKLSELNCVYWLAKHVFDAGRINSIYSITQITNNIPIFGRVNLLNEQMNNRLFSGNCPFIFYIYVHRAITYATAYFKNWKISFYFSVSASLCRQELKNRVKIVFKFSVEFSQVHIRRKGVTYMPAPWLPPSRLFGI